MIRLSAVLAVLLFIAVPASASAVSSPSTGGVAPPPAVGNVNVYYGQLKGAGLLGDNVTAVDKITDTWQPCAVKVCGGYKSVNKAGQKLLDLMVPRRYQLIDGELGYTDNNGLTVNYSWNYDSHKRFSLRVVPLSRLITIDGKSYTMSLSYVEVQ